MWHWLCSCDFSIVPPFLPPSQAPDSNDSGSHSYWASLSISVKCFWLLNRCNPFFCTSLGTLPRRERLIQLPCQTISFKVAPLKVRSDILLMCLGSSLEGNRVFLVIPEIKILSFKADIGTWCSVSCISHWKIYIVFQIFPVNLTTDK